MRSPRKITAEVAAFAEELSPGAGTVLVDCREDRNAVLLECFDTVDAKVRAHGGDRVLGWCLYEWPRAFLVAELHAVWRRPDGTLLDVAKHQVRQSRIAFVPDPTARVPEIQTPNRYFPLCDDPLVARYIAAEAAGYVASDPTSPYLVLTAEVRSALEEIAAAKRALATKYGWPPGTPLSERAPYSLWP